MCTLSWVATGAGYDLFFNRDERIGRGAESAPLETLHEGVRVLAPRDTDAGGTWITVNEHGVTNAILNGYFESDERHNPGRRSRGLLSLDHADVGSPSDLTARIEVLDLSIYAPFTLCSFQPVAGPTLGQALEWDGARLRASMLATDQAPVCSSAIDDAGTRARRTAEWTRQSAIAPMDAARLASFHSSHLDGPSAHSPCMHRSDADTRSMIHVRVDAHRVSMTYTPGAPCRTPADAPLTLDRRAASAPFS
ncbi:MAG: hypothetical protein ACI8QZ_001692 [Chlamydiales bacterium]